MRAKRTNLGKPVERPAPSPARRERLVVAAETLFSRHGLKAVTMAAIAAEAGLAKATVYAYFPDKEALFRAVAERFAEALLAAVEAGLAAEGGTAARIAAALVAKDRLVYRLITSTPHAGELFEARDRLVRELFEDSDRRILARVTAALGDGVARGVTAARLARILVRASRGLAARAENADSLARDIEFTVLRLVDGAR